MHPTIGQVVVPLGRMRPDGTVVPLGTCFAVSSRSFATAAHVIGPSDNNLMLILGKVKSLLEYQDTTDNSVRLIGARIAAYNPIRDIAIVNLIDESTYFSFIYSLGDTDALPPGTPVVSVGYPHADTGRLVVTQQTSTVGARVLLGNNGLKSKHVVLNTQTRPGQSGGPVFSVDGMQVRAMIVGGYSPTANGVSINGIDPQTLHQTTHAVSAEYIREMI